MQFAIIPAEHTPALAEMSNPSEFIKDNIETLINFKKYAKAQKNSVGLASNQCSLNGERIMDRYCAVKVSGEYIIAINPTIETYIGTPDTVVEGCLTWGEGIDIIAARFPKVRVKYTELSGKEIIKLVVNKFDAQIWQHEINHLNGFKEAVVKSKRITPSPTAVKNCIKVGRNDKCPCGSGKKHKVCCG